jgi:hypothetical protein
MEIVDSPSTYSMNDEDEAVRLAKIHGDHIYDEQYIDAIQDLGIRYG